MNSIGVFADVGNLYHCVNKKYGGRKLDYKKYLESVVPDGDILYRAMAYGIQVKDEAAKFISCLRHYGFETKYRRPKIYRNGEDGQETLRRIPWGVGIAMDVVRIVSNNKLDVVVIGSSEPELIDLVEWVKERGVKCIVASCGIPREIREASDLWVEIPEDLLEETTPAE
jgi:uncharacterized LabA/DUF88 family protein